MCGGNSRDGPDVHKADQDADFHEMDPCLFMLFKADHVFLGFHEVDPSMTAFTP